MRKPYQGMPARPLRRPPLDRELPRQSVALMVGFGGLCTDACVAPDRARRHLARARLCQHYPPALAQNRRGGHGQRPPRQAGHEQCLPEPMGVHCRLPCLARRGALSRPYEPATSTPHSPWPPTPSLQTQLVPSTTFRATHAERCAFPAISPYRPAHASHQINGCQKSGLAPLMSGSGSGTSRSDARTERRGCANRCRL